MQLDLIIEDVAIRTGAATRPFAHRIGVWRGLIVGLDEQLDGMRADRVVRGGGAFLMAGFNDAHAHSVWFGQTLHEIDLSDAASPDEVYRRVTAGEPRRDGWVVASGFDPLALPAPLDRDALDRATGGRPLLIKHASGHAYTLNGVGLAAVGVPDRPDAQPEGGVIGIDAEGRASGLLEENAMRVAQDILLPDPVDDIVDALDRATAQYVREGLTSVTDAGIAGGWIGHSPREFAAYQAARERGVLRTRMQPMITADVLHDLAGHAAEARVRGLDAGMRSGLGDERLQVGPMKMFLDGSLLGGTAALSEPYCSCSGSRGYLQGDADEMRAHAVAAAGAGWALALHAIGDRGMDLALDTIAEAVAAHGPAPLPHRIEHGGVVRPEQRERIAALGVSVVPQPYFIARFGDGMAANLGPERTALSYPAASLLAAGANLPGSSDRPVAPGAPLAVVQAFAERRTQSGAAYGPDERISVDEALTAYTVGSARATGWAHRKGTLEPGMLADFVLLADDPRTVAVEQVGGIDVLATWVGGEAVHDTLDA